MAKGSMKKIKKMSKKTTVSAVSVGKTPKKKSTRYASGKGGSY